MLVLLIFVYRCPSVVYAKIVPCLSKEKLLLVEFYDTWFEQAHVDMSIVENLISLLKQNPLDPENISLTAVTFILSFKAVSC